MKDRPGHAWRYAVDARKLEQELGWKPAETFESGIRKTVQGYLANPEWVAHVQSGVYREAAQHYGSIRGALKKQGQPIGVNDLHIAAHARSEGLTLVSNNLREFERVEALQLANWAI